MSVSSTTATEASLNLIKKTKMASMAVANITSNLLQFRNPKEMTSSYSFLNNARTSISFEPPKQDFSTSLLYPRGRGAKHFFQPMCAVQTGLKGPVPNFKDIDSTLKDAQVVVESRDDDTVQVRVDLTGWETHKVFDNVLTNLARVAPPLPGFRNTKRKAFHVPNAYIIRAIGKERITKFVVQEIVTSTVTTYVKKANLKVKKEFRTVQTAEELESVFKPAREFGFSVVLETEKAEVEVVSSSSSDM